jgi:hypothetical protein
MQAKTDNTAILLTPFEHSPHPSARSMNFRLMARRKYRSIPFIHAGRQFEARAVPVTGSWEIWIYENNRALTRYTFIDMQTVKDAERYNWICSETRSARRSKPLRLGISSPRRASGGHRDLAFQGIQLQASLESTLKQLWQTITDALPRPISHHSAENFAH